MAASSESSSSVKDRLPANKWMSVRADYQGALRKFKDSQDNFATTFENITEVTEETKQVVNTLIEKATKLEVAATEYGKAIDQQRTYGLVSPPDGLSLSLLVIDDISACPFLFGNYRNP